MLNNKSIVILGMHRSGTSALAGVFNLLGISFGSNLLSPVEGVNEKGFWEHADLVEINDRLLDAMGYCWHDISSLPDNWWNSEIANKFSTEILDVINRDFSDTSLWGIKDPRLCRLFPLWQQVFDKLVCNPCYVLILRHPSEVCQSLHSRDSFSYIKSIYLWIEHVLESEQWTRDKARSITTYDSLLFDWRSVVTKIGKDLEVVWPINIDSAKKNVDSFISSKLRHFNASNKIPENVSELYKIAIRIYDLMVVKPHTEVEMIKCIDLIHEELEPMQRMFEPLLYEYKTEQSKLTNAFIQAKGLIDIQERDLIKLNTSLADVNNGFSQALNLLKHRTGELNATQSLLNQFSNSEDDNIKINVQTNTQELLTSDANQLFDAIRSDSNSEKVYETIIDISVDNNSHTKMYNFLQTYKCHAPAKILDVGCAAGYFGEFLKEKGYVVHGVENSEYMAKAAANKLDMVYESAIESFYDQENLPSYDCIIFGDVLEHLVSPLEVLRKTANHLEETGFIIASIPNVAHLAVRLMLLSGRWDYQNSGIMDDTHLQFFTRSSIIDMFTAAGYTIIDMDEVRLPPESTGIEFDNEVRTFTEAIVVDEDSDVFQFIVIASPDSRSDHESCNSKFRRIPKLNMEALNGSALIKKLREQISRSENELSTLRSDFEKIDAGFRKSLEIAGEREQEIFTLRSDFEKIDAGFRKSLEVIAEHERQLRELTHYTLFKREINKLWLTITTLLYKEHTLISVFGSQSEPPSIKIKNQPNKILCLLPVLDWSLGDIRIKNPLEELVRTKGGELRRRFVYKYNIHELQNADIVILQRESDNFTLELIKEAKRLGKYIIFDIDDLLTQVPKFISSYEHNLQIKPKLEKALNAVDAITVSTERLKREMLKYNDKVFVVPNCTSNDYPVSQHYETNNKIVTLIVASSDTVRMDFMMKTFKTLCSDPDLSLKIVGIGPPAEMLNSGGIPVEVHSPMSYDDFRYFLSRQDNAIGIIPLDDSRFSSCKSPIKFIDYSLAGIPVIASNLPPYSDVMQSQTTGVLVENKTDNWCNEIKCLAKSYSQRQELADAARQFCLTHYSIDKAALAYDYVFTEVLRIPRKAHTVPYQSTRRYMRKFLLMLDNIRNPLVYKSIYRVLRTEGIQGIWSRMARYF